VWLVDISFTDRIDNGSPFYFNVIENGRDERSSKGDVNVYAHGSGKTHANQTRLNEITKHCVAEILNQLK
jgi:hypothetical protein